jgi:hypothetical protein
MSPEIIRRRAIECMQLAQKPAEPQHRVLLLDLAHSWASLANAVERYQSFIEAAETGKIDNARLKTGPRSPRAARPPRKGINLNRSPSVHHAHRQSREFWAERYRKTDTLTGQVSLRRRSSSPHRGGPA